MVISVLRDANKLSLAEIGRLRRLAMWGRRASHSGKLANHLVLLTGTELFAAHSIAMAWSKADGKEVDHHHRLDDLHILAKMTQRRYLGLKSNWEGHATSHAPEPMLAILRHLTSSRRKNEKS